MVESLQNINIILMDFDVCYIPPNYRLRVEICRAKSKSGCVL